MLCKILALYDKVTFVCLCHLYKIIMSKSHSLSLMGSRREEIESKKIIKIFNIFHFGIMVVHNH
jgi:hypothetical protein